MNKNPKPLFQKRNSPPGMINFVSIFITPLKTFQFDLGVAGKEILPLSALYRSCQFLPLSDRTISDSISDAEIELPGFACVKLDRTGVKEGYGGVVIYIREGLSFCLRDDIDTGGHECLWIELIRDICKPTIICCAYRAPDVDLEGFISSLQSSVPEINFEKSDVILLGDLNVNIMPNSKQPKKTNTFC